MKAWTVKLNKFTSADNFYSLHNSMNQYYAMNRDTFDELIEVGIVGGSKFVQLVYTETVKRDLMEQ